VKRFVVVCCEHTDSYDSPVLLSGQFHTQEEAESYVEDCVRKSIEEFPDEKVADDGLVQTFEEDGRPNYGCVWTVIDLGRGNIGEEQCFRSIEGHSADLGSGQGLCGDSPFAR